jgi:hypothetical protein
MFNEEETTAIVILITDGAEIYAVPASRTGDLTYEVKSARLYQPLTRHTSVAHALDMEGAQVE